MFCYLSLIFINDIQYSPDLLTYLWLTHLSTYLTGNDTDNLIITMNVQLEYIDPCMYMDESNHMVLDVVKHIYKFGTC